MNFQMTEEQEMAVESVRKFVQNEIEPEIRAPAGAVLLTI